MLEYFTPETYDLEDNDHNKEVRDITARMPNTPDEREFKTDEIVNKIEGMKDKKTPCEDGITEEIYNPILKMFPKT